LENEIEKNSIDDFTTFLQNMLAWE